MKPILSSRLVCAILLVIAISVTSSSYLLAQNSFSLYSSGNTGSFMKFKTKTLHSTTRGYVGLNYSKPFQMLQLTGGNILLTRGYENQSANPSSTNGAILFGSYPDSVNSLHGEWGIEYETDYSAGGLNFWKCPSAISETKNFILFLKNNGNVGIGIGNPATALDVLGDVTISNLRNLTNSVLSTDATGKLILKSVSEVGDNLGDHVATQNLDMSRKDINNIYNLNSINSYSEQIYTGQIFGYYGRDYGKLEIYGGDLTYGAKIEIGDGGTDGAIKLITHRTDEIQMITNGKFAMTISSGEIIMGRPDNATDLKVNGKVYSNEVKVTLDKWSDLVFAGDYKLMSLNKLAEYINVNRHLPEIPTEKEVVENGVNIGEMNALLLKKVEELTLYIIDLQKQINALKNEHL